MTAVFLMGPDFANDPQYIRRIKAYSNLAPLLTYFYFLMPSMLRGPLWNLSPLGFFLRYYIMKLKGTIRPEIRRRIDAARRGEGLREQYNVLDEMVALKFKTGVIKKEPRSQDKAKEERQLEIFAEELLFMTFESAGPAALLTLHLINKVMEYSEYRKPLRDEVTLALEATGGQWQDQVLENMPKLKSFTRETLRLEGLVISEDCPTLPVLGLRSQAFNRSTALTAF